MDKSLLVVGGTGVISFAVVNEALKQGFKVTCINRGKSRNQILPKEVETIIANYKDKELISKKLENRHFNAVLDVLCFHKEDIDYSLSIFKDHCDQYLFFSSAEVYNKPKYKNEVYDETAELSNPLWDYSINKALCEIELIRLAKKYGITYTIVRPAITYGNTRIPYGVMPPYGFHGTLIKRIEAHKPIILWDGGLEKAMITRVEDFAIGFVGLLGNPNAYNQAFHICGDEIHTWKDVIDDLGEIMGIKPIYVDIPSKFLASEMPALSQQIIGGRAVNQVLNNRKIKSVVPDFKTNITLREGIKLTVDFYKDNHYLNGIDWAFDADTDRIIKKWCNKNGIDPSSYNLHFIDYLHNATPKDKRVYNLEFNKDKLSVRILRKCLNFYHRVNGKLNRI